MLQEFIEAMVFLGLRPIAKKHYSTSITTSIGTCRIVASYNRKGIKVITCGTKGTTVRHLSNVLSAIDAVEESYEQYMYSILENIAYTSTSDRQSVLAAINTRNLADNLVRCKSSNVWAYGMNIKDKKDKTGDLLMQFKDKNGGPSDLYIYYDVPVVIYRRLQSTPSIGHFFWLNIRNNYRYSKLSGDRHGVLPNAVNNW